MEAYVSDDNCVSRVVLVTGTNSDEGGVVTVDVASFMDVVGKGMGIVVITELNIGKAEDAGICCVLIEVVVGVLSFVKKVCRDCIVAGDVFLSVVAKTEIEVC